VTTRSDVIVAGAGTAGTYFGWLVAKQGYSVVILEQDTRDRAGSRLEVFHHDCCAFEQSGIPPPDKGSPELIATWNAGNAHSPGGLVKKVNHGFHVMRFAPFLHRLHAIAETSGVKLEFSTRVTGFLHEGGVITGVMAERNGERVEFRARLVVDASGIPAILRAALPPSHDVETFRLGPDDVMHVVLRYIKWTKPDAPHFVGINGWAFHKAFCNPCGIQAGAILGIGQPGSFELAEAALTDFLATVTFPPFEVVKVERGITPYRRPPYSLVGDEFLCLGDSACITKPISGEGISAAWQLCRVAATVAGEALAKPGDVTRERLWEINVRYFRNQGAKFAALLAQIPGAANTTAREMDYLFRKDIIFNDEDITAVNRDFEIKLTPAKIARIIGGVSLGLLARQLSARTLKRLMASLSIAGKIKKHYEKFPANPAAFPPWVDAARKLWKKAGFNG
jgi:flavin-dependent dehydrogenase